MDEPVLDARVTRLCELGCARVREVIAALQQGEATPETRDLSPSERRLVLQELQAIMAVYDARD